MRFRRVGSALLLALAGWLPVAPAAAAGEAEWVRVDGDFVVGSAVPRSAGAGADADRAWSGGFMVYDGHESYGTFTVRLRESQGVETLRPYVAQAVKEIAATGLSVTLAAGTTTKELPAYGDILVQVSTTSPCEGSWSGCGGPRTSVSVAGRQYWASGQAWFHPNALTFADHNRQHLVSHEIGHALGLRHYDDSHAGESQVMHSTSFAARSYRSGDRAGLSWLRPDPPPNDRLAAAAAIGPETTVARGTNGFATAEPFEHPHAGSSAQRSVWYRWTAPRDGSATFDTARSAFDTRIAVYSGTTHDSLVLLAEQDDSPWSDRAVVSIGAQAGTTYSIAVDSHGSMGVVQLDLVFGGPVPNDDFHTATELPARGGTTTGANVGTTLESNEPEHGTRVKAHASAWFRWYAPRDGDVSMSTRGSNFDTVLAVYTGNYLDALTRVAANDDDVGTDSSRVTFRAVAGTTYQIAVAGFSEATGAITLFVDSGIDRYSPVTPHRVLDSRSTRPWARGETRHVPVTGRNGVPLNGVSAVLLNVTAVAPSAPGFLTVWPAGSPRPYASNLNFRAGQTVANAVQAKVGPDGRIAIHNAGGVTHVLVDVAGYLAPDALNGFDPAPSPIRLLDSRLGIGTPGTAWNGGETRNVVVAGTGGVPADATAVVLNLTAVSPTSAGYVTASPAGAARPVVSSLNLAPGRTVANLVVAKVGARGAVSLFNSRGRTHLVADVLGWYAPNGRLAGTTAAPVRILDSRAGLGTPPAAWRPGETRTVAVTGKAGVPVSGVEAVVLNVTAIAPTASGYLALWRGGTPRPTASTLNFAAGHNVPNLAVVAVGPSGWANVHNALGSTHVAADVAGWFFQPPDS